MTPLLLAVTLAFQPGDRLHVSGLVCTELAPWQHMAEVAATHTPEIARMFLNEDMYRLDRCAVIPRPLAILLGEEASTFDIGPEHYSVFAARAGGTGRALFVAVPASASEQGVRPLEPSI